MHIIARSDTALGQLEDMYSTATGSTDSGVDIPCPNDVTIPGRQSVLIDLECTVRIYPDDHPNSPTTAPDASPFLLMARSGCSKPGGRSIILTNGVGLIDKGYVGNLKAQFYNLGEDPVTIEKGTCLVQAVHPSYVRPQVLVDSDTNPFIQWVLKPDDARGGGFGSTGRS